MKFGFALRRLTLAGPDVENAELHFTRGLNVITGPSDTGKTFIAQCIDFAMGSGEFPKEIPEAAQYTSVILELESRATARTFTLKRAFAGGDIRLSADGVEDRILAAKHQAEREDTVSWFLLNLSGLTGKKVRTNQQGKTRPLSFRDIARLIIVDEESVIAATSPVLSGQHMGETAEIGVFRMLLTGRDDSAVIATEDRKIAKGRQEGKVEVLETLLQRTREQIAERKLVGTLATLREELTRLEEASESASAELAVEQKNAAVLEERRRVAWSRLRQVESRVDVLSELQKRFALLDRQYTSDLRRLDAIAEAGARLEQMKEERCPVCGAPGNYHDVEHQQERAAPADVVEACRAEALKTTRLVRDLQSTLASNAAEVATLNLERSGRQAELEATGAELSSVLQPRLQAVVQRVRDTHAQRDSCRRALDLLERAQELEQLLAEASARPKKPATQNFAGNVSSADAERFSQEVEALLRSWHFPNLQRVTFSEESQDIVISGRPRASHGKGVRAITRAAFNLALLRLCEREERPFAGMVLIDSPLVVYREPDAEEGSFPLDVKDAFYEGVAAEFADLQVIILENDEPPGTILERANLVSFTGTNHGRRGFVPLS